MKHRKQKIKYISIKLPACDDAYPFDRYGCRILPNYTKTYLRKHGKKLFDILLNKVPADVYSQLLEKMREVEKI